jgi:signal peptidase I
MYKPASNFSLVQVPAGQYLLLGDDRDNSMDSRYFGLFPRNEMVGRSRYVVASLNHYLPRGERFGAALNLCFRPAAATDRSACLPDP